MLMQQDVFGSLFDVAFVFTTIGDVVYFARSRGNCWEKIQ